MSRCCVQEPDLATKKKLLNHLQDVHIASLAAAAEPQPPPPQEYEHYHFDENGDEIKHGGGGRIKYRVLEDDDDGEEKKEADVNLLTLIPVVFHICYNMPNDARTVAGIQLDAEKTIAVLNQDFNNQAPDYGADQIFGVVDVQPPPPPLAPTPPAPSVAPPPPPPSAPAPQMTRAQLLAAIAKSQAPGKPRTLASWGKQARTSNNQKEAAAFEANSRTIVQAPPKVPESSKTLYKNYLARAGSAQVKFVLQEIVRPPANAIRIPKTLPNGDPTYALNQSIKVQGSRRRAKALNIWVAELPAGLLGYSSFPWEANPELYDGVVVSRATFETAKLRSPYHLRRTATHEVGHWCGLFHTFQQGISVGGNNFDLDGDGKVSWEEQTGDCVGDTPFQRAPNFTNMIATPAAAWPFQSGMWPNFMDYTPDIGMRYFTKEACVKMHLSFAAWPRDLEFVKVHV